MLHFAWCLIVCSVTLNMDGRAGGAAAAATAAAVLHINAGFLGRAMGAVADLLSVSTCPSTSPLSLIIRGLRLLPRGSRETEIIGNVCGFHTVITRTRREEERQGWGVGGGGFTRPEPRLVYSTEGALKIEIGGVFLF